MKRNALVLMLAAAMLGGCGRPAEDQDPEGGAAAGSAGSGDPAGSWQDEARAAVKKGAERLASLAKDGRWAFDPKYGPDLGTTALALRAMLQSPGAEVATYGPTLDWLAENQHEDGGIYDPRQGVMTYVTASAVLAMKASGDARFDSVTARAARYLAKIQADEGESIAESSENYGGIGYGSKRQFTNMSTSQFAIEAADAAGLEKDHEFYKKALRFLSRSQNRSESNDLPAREVDGVKVVPGNDGGAFYRPGESKAGIEKLSDGRSVFRSYGSMTYSLLKSYLLCDLDPRDERVKAALAWMGENYQLEWNPGMEHDTANGPESRYQGLYYYYLSIARCLAVAEKGKVALPEELQGWREDLSRALVSRQKDDGGWQNHVGRWYEDKESLCTAYALITLQACLGEE